MFHDITIIFPQTLPHDDLLGLVTQTGSRLEAFFEPVTSSLSYLVVCKATKAMEQWWNKRWILLRLEAIGCIDICIDIYIYIYILYIYWIYTVYILYIYRIYTVYILYIYYIYCIHIHIYIYTVYSYVCMGTAPMHVGILSLISITIISSVHYY